MNANVCSHAPNSGESIADDLIECYRTMSSQTCRFLIQLREFDLHRAYKSRRHPTKEGGHRNRAAKSSLRARSGRSASSAMHNAPRVHSAANSVEWLAVACGMDEEVARQKLAVAYALANLPRIEEAFEAGSLSYAKVRALVRVANTANEGSMLDFAGVMTDAQVEDYCNRLAARERLHPSSP